MTNTETKDDYITQLHRFNKELYPDREEEVTANRMMRYGIGRALAMMEMKDAAADVAFKADATDAEKRAYHFAAEAMICHYDTVFLIKALQEVDAAKAEEVVKVLWGDAESGDSYGEILWEWAVENDIPVDPRTLGNKTVEQHKAEIAAFYAKSDENEAGEG
jgi:hypothetical protein